MIWGYHYLWKHPYRNSQRFKLPSTIFLLVKRTYEPTEVRTIDVGAPQWAMHSCREVEFLIRGGWENGPNRRYRVLKGGEQVVLDVLFYVVYVVYVVVAVVVVVVAAAVVFVVARVGHRGVDCKQCWGMKLSPWVKFLSEHIPWRIPWDERYHLPTKFTIRFNQCR